MNSATLLTDVCVASLSEGNCAEWVRDRATVTQLNQTLTPVNGCMLKNKNVYTCKRPRTHKHTWQIFFSTDRYGVDLKPVSCNDSLMLYFTALQLRLSVDLPSILTHIYTSSPCMLLYIMNCIIQLSNSVSYDDKYMTLMCNTAVWFVACAQMLGFDCIHTQRRIITCKHCVTVDYKPGSYSFYDSVCNTRPNSIFLLSSESGDRQTAVQ